MRARLSGVSAWTVGLSTAIAVLAGVAFQVLGYLNLRILATILAAVGVAVLGWLAQRVKAANDKRQSWSGRVSSLEDALAVWPLRRVKDVADGAFDAGLFPFATEALRADASGAGIDERLQPGGIMLVVGPAGCGKSELALDMLREQLPDAWLIVPENARGLASLLSLDPPFGIAPEQSAVLLLDGCGRFLPGLQLGALDELRARCKRLFVVATIRDDELRTLLSSDKETGYVARRLVARARVVPVATGRTDSARSSQENRAAGGILASRWGAARAPLIAVPSESEAQPPGEAVLLPAAPRRVAQDWGVRALAAGALALAGGFAAVWLAEGLEQPAPVATQLTAVTNEADGCGSRFVYAPKSADAISGDRPVVIVTRDAGRCHVHKQSDKLSVLVPVAGRLTEVYAFQPAGANGGVYQFRCAGTMPGDPCLTNIAGTSAYAITGAFTNTNTLISYPIEILQAGDGFSAAPIRESGQAGGGHGPHSTTLSDGATAVTVVPTTAFSVVQPLAGQPPVYIEGQISSGSFDFPRALKISAWSPTAGAAQASFDHECRPLASGETLQVSFVRGSGDFVADLGSLLGRYWTRVARTDGESCP